MTILKIVTLCPISRFPITQANPHNYPASTAHPKWTNGSASPQVIH